MVNQNNGKAYKKYILNNFLLFMQTSLLPQLPQGISHHRQRSSPETFTRINNQSPTAGVKRNNSDAQAKEAARQKVREGKVNVVEPLSREKKQRKDFEAIGRVRIQYNCSGGYFT